MIDRRPRDHGELVAFVAHDGARVARKSGRHDIEGLAVRALGASRSDPALARMLPVFLWRVRDDIDTAAFVRAARRRRLGPAAG